jgi:four helix bundle protein
MGLENSDISGRMINRRHDLDKEEMKNRTREFAKRIINLCRHLLDNREGRLIGDQLFRSGTSMASNYRASCRARSYVEVNAKLAIVEEESDESLFWLEMLKEMDVIKAERLEPLIQENNEILSIIVKSGKTAKNSRKKSN